MLILTSRLSTEGHKVPSWEHTRREGSVVPLLLLASTSTSAGDDSRDRLTGVVCARTLMGDVDH